MLCFNILPCSPCLTLLGDGGVVAKSSDILTWFYLCGLFFPLGDKDSGETTAGREREKKERTEKEEEEKDKMKRTGCGRSLVFKSLLSFSLAFTSKILFHPSLFLHFHHHSHQPFSISLPTLPCSSVHLPLSFSLLHPCIIPSLFSSVSLALCLSLSI